MLNLQLRIGSVLSIAGLVAICTAPSLPSASECLGWLLQQADPLLVGARDEGPVGGMVLAMHRPSNRSSFGTLVARKPRHSKSRSRSRSSSAGRRPRKCRGATKHESVPRRRCKSAEPGGWKSSRRRRRSPRKSALEWERSNWGNARIQHVPEGRHESAAEHPVGFLAPLGVSGQTGGATGGTPVVQRTGAAPTLVGHETHETRFAEIFEHRLKKASNVGNTGIHSRDALVDGLHVSPEDVAHFIKFLTEAITKLEERKVPEACHLFVKAFNQISRGVDADEMEKGQALKFLRRFAALPVIREALLLSCPVSPPLDEHFQSKLTAADAALDDAPLVDLSVAVGIHRRQGISTGLEQKPVDIPKLDQDVDTFRRLIVWVAEHVEHAVDSDEPGRGVMPMAHFIEELHRLSGLRHRLVYVPPRDR